MNEKENFRLDKSFCLERLQIKREFGLKGLYITCLHSSVCRALDFLTDGRGFDSWVVCNHCNKSRWLEQLAPIV